MGGISKAYLLMILSTVFYAFDGVIDYIVVKGIGTGGAALSIGTGMLMGLLLALLLFKMRLKLKSGNYYLFSGLSALLIVLYNLLLFIAYVKYTLASIYPLIGLSALIFLIIDLLKYRKGLSRSLVITLLFAVSFIVVGVFFAESTGFDFNINTLPFVIGISTFAGIGYYMLFYKIKKYSIGSKIIFEPFLMLILALLFIHHTVIIPSYMLIGIIGGVFFTLASAFELMAFKSTDTHLIRETVIKRNLVNDFEYADTLFVMLGSVLIGSFTFEQIFGGVLIVIGIIILNYTK